MRGAITTALLRLKNIVISYEGVIAVNGASFSVEKGDYLVLIGENGSGKSSVMKAMLGLVRPKSGEIIYSVGFRKNQIGYLPQQTPVQRDFPASVREVVYSGLAARMRQPFFVTKELKELAVRCMEMLDITDIAGSAYRALSGGQQQRVLLARALCATDSLLLLDEPVTGLDPHATEEMYSVIKKLNDSGVAIVTVSHDVSGALRDAKHVLIMDHASSRYETIDEYRRHADEKR